MFKIGIIGPECSGKTTLSRYLAEQLDGVWVEEYARTYVEALGRAYTYSDVEAIARHQIEELHATYYRDGEEAKYVFFDTELIITKVWFEHKWGKCPDFLTEALTNNPIDFYLLCAPDLPFEPDPVRENPHLREYLFEWYKREVEAMGKPYKIVEGERKHIKF